MENFAIHDSVLKLVQSFGLPSEHALPFVDTFTKSVSSPRSIEFQAAFSNVINGLKEKSENAELFLSKYERLKLYCPPLVSRMVMIFFCKLKEYEIKRPDSRFSSTFSTPASTARGYEDLFNSRHNSSFSGFEAQFSDFPVQQKLTEKIITNVPEIKNYGRPFLSNSFVKNTVDSQQPIDNSLLASIENKTVTEQEELLVEDILFVMQGIEGTFISVNLSTNSTEPLRFSINPLFDVSLRSLASRILPLCSDYKTVASFLDDFFNYRLGTVAQAYCSAVRTICEEYLTVVCQLECQHKVGQLSMQKLWFYVQPLQRSMKVLSVLCGEIEKTKVFGGAILTLLHARSNDFIGDKTAQDVCIYLLQASSKPYLHILERWLYTGHIEDPYNEFMITEKVAKQRHISGSLFDEVEDWERRYIFKRELCPDYLFSVSNKILNCGKYINITSSCGHTNNVVVKSLDQISNDRAFLLAIEEAHNSSSFQLVKLLIDRFDLLERFRSLKHYFLIDQGDWLLHFLELADDELNLCVDDVRPHRLESLLDLALRTSSMVNDQFREDIKIEISPSTLTAFLLTVIQVGFDVEDSSHKLPLQPTSEVRAIEAFTIRYDAHWPLSIVFHRGVMTKYQIIFRRLLMCKYVERRLSCYWISNRHQSFEYLILYQMMSFLKNYMYYVTAEVLEPNWHKFWSFLSDSNSSMKQIAIDDVLLEHHRFLDDCTKDCLLTDDTLVAIVDKIFKLCLALTADVVRDINVLKQEFLSYKNELSTRMQSLSNSFQERTWADIAYRLDLQL